MRKFKGATKEMEEIVVVLIIAISLFAGGLSWEDKKWK